MTHLQELVELAVDAQRTLIYANDLMRRPLSREDRLTVTACANVHRARLDVFAQHFMALPCANDAAMEAVPV